MLVGDQQENIGLARRRLLLRETINLNIALSLLRSFSRQQLAPLMIMKWCWEKFITFY